jgi:hypothetical protein
VAAFLHVAVRDAQIVGPGGRRSGRRRPEPSARVGRRRPPADPQLLAEPPDGCFALPDREIRFRRSAHSARRARHLPNGGAAARGGRAHPRHPENYYDDLEARTDLPPAEIEKLRAADILYDRDGNTEFFQFYTASLEGGFFFEIVERRGYAGYGAPNAPIRLAAQTRENTPPAT